MGPALAMGRAGPDWDCVWIAGVSAAAVIGLAWLLLARLLQRGRGKACMSRVPTRSDVPQAPAGGRNGAKSQDSAHLPAHTVATDFKTKTISRRRVLDKHKLGDNKPVTVADLVADSRTDRSIPSQCLEQPKPSPSSPAPDKDTGNTTQSEMPFDITPRPSLIPADTFDTTVQLPISIASSPHRATSFQAPPDDVPMPAGLPSTMSLTDSLVSGDLAAPCVITPMASYAEHRVQVSVTSDTVLPAPQPPPSPTTSTDTPRPPSLAMRAPYITPPGPHPSSTPYSIPVPASPHSAQPPPSSLPPSTHLPSSSSRPSAALPTAPKMLPSQKSASKGSSSSSKVDKAARGIATLGRKASHSLASIKTSLLSSLREVASQQTLNPHRTDSRGPTAMFSGSTGEKRAAFKGNKVAPTPTFYAMVHPRPTSTCNSMTSSHDLETRHSNTLSSANTNMQLTDLREQAPADTGPTEASAAAHAAAHAAMQTGHNPAAARHSAPLALSQPQPHSPAPHSTGSNTSVNTTGTVVRHPSEAGSPSGVAGRSQPPSAAEQGPTTPHSRTSSCESRKLGLLGLTPLTLDTEDRSLGDVTLLGRTVAPGDTHHPAWGARVHQGVPLVPGGDVSGASSFITATSERPQWAGAARDSEMGWPSESGAVVQLPMPPLNLGTLFAQRHDAGPSASHSPHTRKTSHLAGSPLAGAAGVAPSLLCPSMSVGSEGEGASLTTPFRSPWSPVAPGTPRDLKQDKAKCSFRETSASAVDTPLLHRIGSTGSTAHAPHVTPPGPATPQHHHGPTPSASDLDLQLPPCMNELLLTPGADLEALGLTVWSGGNLDSMDSKELLRIAQSGLSDGDPMRAGLAAQQAATAIAAAGAWADTGSCSPRTLLRQTTNQQAVTAAQLHSPASTRRQPQPAPVPSCASPPAACAYGAAACDMVQGGGGAGRVWETESVSSVTEGHAGTGHTTGRAVKRALYGREDEADERKQPCRRFDSDVCLPDGQEGPGVVGAGGSARRQEAQSGGGQYDATERGTRGTHVRLPSNILGSVPSMQLPDSLQLPSSTDSTDQFVLCSTVPVSDVHFTQTSVGDASATHSSVTAPQGGVAPVTASTSSVPVGSAGTTPLTATGLMPAHMYPGLAVAGMPVTDTLLLQQHILATAGYPGFSAFSTQALTPVTLSTTTSVPDSAAETTTTSLCYAPQVTLGHTLLTQGHTLGHAPAPGVGAQATPPLVSSTQPIQVLTPNGMLAVLTPHGCLPALVPTNQLAVGGTGTPLYLVQAPTLQLVQLVGRAPAPTCMVASDGATLTPPATVLSPASALAVAPLPHHMLAPQSASPHPMTLVSQPASPVVPRPAYKTSLTASVMSVKHAGGVASTAARASGAATPHHGSGGGAPPPTSGR